MQDTENASEHSDNAQEVPPPEGAPLVSPNNVDDEQIDSGIQQNSADRQTQTQPPIIGGGDDKKSLAKEYPLITAISNVIMALGAIIAVFISAQSLNISNESLRLTRESIQGGNKRDSILIATTQKSANAADSSFRETQNQFAIGNEPYLQYIICFADLSSKKKLISIPAIVNYGKYPVIIEEYRICRRVFPLIMDDSFFRKNASVFHEQNLVSADMPMVISADTLNSPSYEAVAERGMNIRGEIKYRDLIRKNEMVYGFELRYVQPDVVYYGRRYVVEVHQK